MLILGDCIEEMKKLPENSVPALVTDPPYGWAFMGKEWDKKREPILFQEWTTTWALEALRVLKPGAHALVFCGPRTYHRMASGVEDAGFEIRDCLSWLFGSGFPKSHDVSKAIDKAYTKSLGQNGSVTAPSTEAAKQWQGWGTALKPAVEFIVLARKPLSEKTVAENVLKWGTGGINIDASRIRAYRADDSNVHTSTSHKGDRKKGTQHIENLASFEHLPSCHNYRQSNADERGHDYLLFQDSQVDCRALSRSHDERVHASLIDGQEPFQQQGDVLSPVCPCSLQSHTHIDASKPLHIPTIDIQAPQGRFPANLLFSHNEDCIEVGVKKVKRDAGGPQGKYAREGTQGTGIVYTLEGNDHPRTSYQDPDGTETVSAFECTPGCAVAELDRQSGRSKTGIYKTVSETDKDKLGFSGGGRHTNENSYTDSGGASRFFYVAKASKRERNEGREELPEKQTPSNMCSGSVQKAGEGTRLDGKPLSKNTNFHPTVKPIRLMSYLINMITPPGGTILDPFMGSGSTGCAAIQCGFEFIGIEKESEYFEIAQKRIDYHKAKIEGA